MASKPSPYKQLNDGLVAEICSLIEEGLSTQQACAIVGVSYNTLRNVTTGETPRQPDWSQCIARARAVCVRGQIGRLRRNDLQTQDIKAAHHLLYAIDKRFRENKSAISGAVVVQLVSPQDALQTLPGVRVLQLGDGVAEAPGTYDTGDDPASST